MAEEKQSKKVKVKMLRQVGPHQAGDEVELDEEHAEDLCKPSPQQVGSDVQNLQKAVKVEDFEKAKTEGLDVSQLTQAEMDALGRKNVIASPYDSHHPKVAHENTKKLEQQPALDSKPVDPKAPPVDNDDKGKAKKK